jgi:hypothetical protein
MTMMLNTMIRMLILTVVRRMNSKSDGGIEKIRTQFRTSYVSEHWRGSGHS